MTITDEQAKIFRKINTINELKASLINCYEKIAKIKLDAKSTTISGIIHLISKLENRSIIVDYKFDYDDILEKYQVTQSTTMDPGLFKFITEDILSKQLMKVIREDRGNNHCIPRQMLRQVNHKGTSFIFNHVSAIEYLTNLDERLMIVFAEDTGK